MSEYSLYGIRYETWHSICQMYFDMKNGVKKAYLQWFHFSKLSVADKNYISGEIFFREYIQSGAFVIFTDTMHQTENFIQKSDGSFRESSLISPILYLVLQSIGKEISERYTSQQFDNIEVFNYFLYENQSELKSAEVISAIVELVKHDLSFISLDPKRLTVMIMKTNSDKAIKAFLNQLFVRNRLNKWNSYDTTIAITYLIQSKFQHIDLLRILEKKCPEISIYYQQ